MSTVIQSKEPCPVCLLQNGIPGNMLTSRPGSPTGCNAGHKFEDTEELRILQSQAKQRFPNIYTSLAPKPPTPTDPAIFAGQDILITSEMRKFMEEASGTTITGPSDLKGLIYGLTHDNKNLEGEVRALKASVATMRPRPGAGTGQSTGLAPGQTVITIPEWALAGVTEQAEYSQMTIEEWVAQQVNSYFENYFGGVVHRT